MAPYNDKTAVNKNNSTVNKKKDTNDASQAKPENNQVEPENSMTKHSIYFVGGEKGGVGKSFFTRCMLDYFIARGWKNEFALIEADPTMNDVSSVYDKGCEKVIFSDNKFGDDEPNIIIDKAADTTVIVNLPSNVSRQFDEWSQKIGLLSPETKEYCDITYFFVTDGCHQSIQQFLTFVDKYPSKELSVCLIFNGGRLTSGGSFFYLEEHADLMKAIKTHKIPVLQIPVLASSVQFQSDSKQMTYRELYEKADRHAYKQVLKFFLNELDNFFQMVFPNEISSTDLSKIAKVQEKYRKKGQLAIVHCQDFK